MAIVFLSWKCAFILIQMEAFIKGYNGKFNYKMNKNKQLEFTKLIFQFI
jgi:hypothetical protein